MAVFQPLYYSGGKYSAGVDRMLLSALMSPETDGSRKSGVIPANFGSKSMKVVNAAGTTGRILTILQGMCVIQDATAPSIDSPGAYLCGVDTSTETITISANSGSTRVDTIYAVVDETPYIITKKKLDANVATITTSTDHGFKVGQTVVVSGVDPSFDGSHVITAVSTSSPFTFSYTGVGTIDSGANVNVTATATVGTSSFVLTTKELTSNVATVTTSSAHGIVDPGASAGKLVTIKGVDGTFDGTYEIIDIPTSTKISYARFSPNIAEAAISNSYSTAAIARVPFAIKVEEAGGTTLDGKTKIKLATVSVPGSSSPDVPNANITDTREFVGLLGGVHYYNSTAVDSSLYPSGATGKLRFDVATNSYQIYDGVASAWRSMLHSNGASGTFTISVSGPTGGSNGDIWVQI